MFYYSYLSTEPPAVSIQSTRPALQDNENTTLNCTADGGYPPTSSISFIKNGRVIFTTSFNQLMISVAAGHTGCSPFGRYVCLVNNSVTTMETSFLMKQKGDDYCRYCELDRGGYTCSADFSYQVKYFIDILWVIQTLVWYFLSSGELQVVLNFRSSGQCNSLNVSVYNTVDAT